MNPESSENSRWYALVFGLTAILVLLALLQYRSTRQVSDATTEHMRASLEDGLMDLRQGFERELTPLCYQFQSDAETREDALGEYGEGLERWRQLAAHPKLVSQFFVWRRAGKNPQLLQWNEGSTKMKSATWPPEFSSLHEWLDRATLRQISRGGGLAASDPDDASAEHSASAPPDRILPTWLIDESIPALVHPMQKKRRTGGSSAGTDWIILRLDTGVLEKEVLTELVRRNFGRNSESAYKIAVVADDHSRDPIFSSDGSFGWSKNDAADASINLFGRPVPTLSKGHESSKYLVIPAMPPLSQQPDDATAAAEPGTDNDEDGPIRIEPIHYAGQNSDWELLARHREGSVEAAVTSGYYRNLAINFGVLLVLGITMGLIIATSRRARRLAQAQVDFVAGVSHELRTPLTGIVSAAQNMSDGLVEGKERTTRYGAAILSQAKQLTDLVEQILLFSATQKRAHRYHLQPADVIEIVDASLKTTSSLIRSSGFTVQRTVPTNLPQVVVDAQALSQCLQNLITNSVKYSGNSRWIGLEAAEAGDASSGREVMISVEDRGLGMTPEDLEHIFEPFYRSPVVTEAQIHGSGLGLPLTKSMVEAMGGRLSVASEPQRGSRFTIHLPLRDAEPPSTPSDAAVPATTSS